MMRAVLLAALAFLAAPALAESETAPLDLPETTLVLVDLTTGEPTVIKRPSDMTAEDGKRFVPQEKASLALYEKLVNDGREPIRAIIDVIRDYLARSKAAPAPQAPVDAKK